MADLPDLTTGDIGFCAYWNAIDQGEVGSVDPEEALSDGRIEEYTLYDNGWEAESYNSVTGRDIKVRAKTDGWFVAYMDRTEEFESNVGSPSDARGPWDLGNDWTDWNNNSDFVENTLADAINSVASELENWDSISFDYSDVGLYNFEYSDSAGITGMSTQEQDYEGFPDNTSGFVYTDGTTIDWAACAGSTNGSSGTTVEFEGSEVADGGSSHGALDILDAGLIEDEGTEYQMTISGDEFEDTAYAHGDVLLIWT